jgi:hypothetical protein
VLQTYWKLLGIIFVAFALRVAVRCYFGSADFWINGYTFYVKIAQSIAAGEGISSWDARAPLYPSEEKEYAASIILTPFPIMIT